MFRIKLKDKLLSSKLPSEVVSLFEDVRAILAYSAGILKKHKADLRIILVLKMLAFPLGLSIIYITKATLDKGIFAKNLDMFLKFLALGMTVFFLTQVLRYLSDKLVQEVRAKFSVDVNYALTDRLFGLDYLRIKELSSAEHAFVLDYDYHICEKLVFDDVPSVISVLKIPVFFVLAFMLSWPLTLLVLVTLPFMALHTIWASGRRKKYKTRQLSSSRKYYSTFLDFLRNIKLIKSFAKEEWVIERVMVLFREKINSTLRSLLFSYKSRLIKGLFLKTSAGVFLLVGGYLIIKGRMTFGSFSAVSMYMAFITSEAYNLSSFVQGLNEDRVSIMRNAAFIKEITKKREEAVPARVIEGPEFGRDIAFQNISFGYTKDRTLFKDLSLVIPAKKWTLIRGESGVGKTTLLSLFLRLFPAREGKIFIGDHAVERIERSDFFRNISVVHQEPYLFDDTLINNILMGKDRNIRDIEKALRCARLGELAGELFSGYNNHRLGESGSTLSGGQKQRVAIARALAREPKILVFDEATSFLDSNMEEDIFRDIKRSFPSLTVIFVTHRDTAKKFADEIFVLEDGGMLRGDSYGEVLSGEKS